MIKTTHTHTHTHTHAHTHTRTHTEREGGGRERESEREREREREGERETERQRKEERKRESAREGRTHARTHARTHSRTHWRAYTLVEEGSARAQTRIKREKETQKHKSARAQTRRHTLQAYTYSLPEEITAAVCLPAVYLPPPLLLSRFACLFWSLSLIPMCRVRTITTRPLLRPTRSPFQRFRPRLPRP